MQPSSPVSDVQNALLDRWAGTASAMREHYRRFCVLAGVLNPAFGIVYLFTSPEAVDPLWARLSLGVLSLLLLSLSYMSAWVRTHFVRLVQIYLYGVIAFYVGLTALNGFAPDYTMGMMFVITAVGIIFSLGLTRTKPLTRYLSFTVLLVTPAIYLASAPQVSPAIVSICAVSISVVIYVAAHSKIRAEEAMHASELRYRTLMNAANDAIFIVEAETWQILDANDRAQQLSGWPLEDLQRMTIAELFPEEQRAASAALFQRHVVEGGSISSDVHLRQRDGRHTPVDVSASLVEIGGQRLIQGILRDATERHHYERQLIEAKDHAEEMLRLKTSFLNNMSHEIRTPLTSILGFSDLLVDEIAEEHREFVCSIHSSAKRLHQTLNSVLDLAQLESGKRSIGLEVLHLGSEIEETVSLMRLLADQKNLSLRVVVNAPDAHVAVDQGCLSRIVNNLVGNAIKFTEEGYVTVEVDADDAWAYLHVRDTGIGITEEFQQHLFDEFRQESTGIGRSFEGNGLGLAITKRLVDLLEGTISVNSIKDVGSTFTVALPRACPEEAGRQAAAAPDAETREEHPSVSDGEAEPERPAPPRILIVEDNPATRSLLKHWLSERYDVELVAGPEAALERADVGTYDVLLVDINLTSRRNGVDLLGELRQRPGYERTPAIALTVYSMPGDREHFLASGFDYYLSKPFTLHDLLEVVGEASGVAAFQRRAVSAASF